jgi:hypothetical protein
MKTEGWQVLHTRQNIKLFTVNGTAQSLSMIFDSSSMTSPLPTIQ